ncbi:sugar O-acyltransferase, sialic acid O-acetyltransferase NeuD family [Catonella morbi ATCC 51271]|uniref:Sugar O-acyltransferase, sialic acid O-acetyltransferase NeuD family n=1 Tax=Catonella morbi ATCC 51271 TaxID=592026 RepID=V2ZA23_9FIRM|nr:NeuD/PglB/VioB family sugar acetyltransferase [Catonella morbi]ESL03775.1 sugar O-acyltransferase, sialic acid O-acetyltransferase NeuD family [Catonella morbi ATCC 51271]
MVLGIYGYGGHGLEVEELARVINLKENRWEKIIFVDDAKDKIDNEKIFSFEDIISKYSPKDIEFMTGIGEPVIREKLYNKVKEKDYSFAILVHPSASVAESAILEEGTMVAHNAFVSIKAHLFTNTLVQPMACVHHECSVGRNSVVSTSAVMGGNSSLGYNSFIGLGASVKQGISVGNGSVVGMGAIVIKNVSDRVMVVGNPARAIKMGDLRAF